MRYLSCTMKQSMYLIFLIKLHWLIELKFITLSLSLSYSSKFLNSSSQIKKLLNANFFIIKSFSSYFSELFNGDSYANSDENGSIEKEHIFKINEDILTHLPQSISLMRKQLIPLYAIFKSSMTRIFITVVWKI